MSIRQYFVRKRRERVNRKYFSQDYINRSKKLKRVSHGSRSKIQGASEAEIQEIKTGLDTNIIKGYKERESKRELKRLGFLH